MMESSKKILFVVPPYFDEDDSMNDITPNTLPAFSVPYGVLSIDAYIKANAMVGLETALIDLNIGASMLLTKEHKYHASYFPDLVKKEVRSFKPDIVAISALFNKSYNYIDFITSIVKEQSESILTVIGGGLATNLYSKILAEFPHIDAVCYGEGEIPMLDLVNSTDHERLFAEHQSWATRKTIKSGKVLVNTFVPNLDEIPEFDYSLVNLNDYNARSYFFDLANRSMQEKREMSIHTSRGCPFNCVFCANGKLHGKKLRFMSVEKVINDVKMMKDKFGLTVLMIEDDNFLFDKERAKTILRKLSEFDLQLEFPNGLAVYAIDEEMGQLLKKAGATTIPLAIESGSDYVLQKIINKPLKTSMVKSRVKILRENGIQVHAFIVIGIPGETHEHRLVTLNFIKDVGFDWVHVSIVIPIVGSRLYDICVDNNYLLNTDLKDHIKTRANIKAPDVDPVEIEEFAYYMNLSVNFVSNFNMLQRENEKAAMYFSNVAKKIPEHAFAHYYLAQAYERMNYDAELVKYHMAAFYYSVEKHENWKRYAKLFNLL